jgi:two-component system chemotaxis response regulator CheB
VKKIIRVLVVDDSIVCCEVLTELLNRADDIQVAGTATSGKEAIILNRHLRPDLITMDVQMPGLDGFATIEEIMASLPVPILMVTSSPVHRGVDRTFQALSAGALDLMEKPDLDSPLTEVLHEKVRLLSGVQVIHRRRKATRQKADKIDRPSKKKPIVAITSSTGGPKLLHEILSALPRNLSSCILVTQHIPDGFSQGLAEWLNTLSSLEVCEAVENMRIKPGRVIIAPSNRHLIMRTPKSVGLSKAAPVGNHRPSGTTMFQSLAKVCPKETIGIILSGMGRDGAEGLLELSRAGGYCFAQDELSSLVFGMPKAAIEIGATNKTLNINSIINLLVDNGTRSDD